MDKTTLNAQLVTTGRKRVFLSTSNLSIAKDQICEKFGLVVNEKE